MKLGISSYTFGWAVGVPGYSPARPLDELGLLDKAVELGVKLLQIGDNIALNNFSPKRLSSLANRACDLGIELEVGGRGLTVPNVHVYAKTANALRAQMIRFVIDDKKYHPTPEAVTAILREIAPGLEGLTLGIENHDRFPAATLRGIIEDVGSERIGICLDTANSLGAGEGIETVGEILGPLTVNLHIKDFAIERVEHLMGFTVTGRPAGEGMLNLPRVLQQVSRSERCRTAVLELWTPRSKDVQTTIAHEARWAVQSIKYLTSYFAKS